VVTNADARRSLQPDDLTQYVDISRLEPASFVCGLIFWRTGISARGMASLLPSRRIAMIMVALDRSPTDLLSDHRIHDLFDRLHHIIENIIDRSGTSIGPRRRRSGRAGDRIPISLVVVPILLYTELASLGDGVPQLGRCRRRALLGIASRPPMPQIAFRP
jgi:hypothetical protein